MTSGGGNTALLIVDVQRGFVNRYTRDVPAKVEALQYGYDIVFATRFSNPFGSPFRRFLGWDGMGGREDTALAFSVKEGVRIIEKEMYSCVTESFLRELVDLNVREVHICGVDTDACVSKCALDLFDRGVRPVVLERYCASSGGRAFHRAAIRQLRRNIGRRQVR